MAQAVRIQPLTVCIPDLHPALCRDESWEGARIGAGT